MHVYQSAFALLLLFAPGLAADQDQRGDPLPEGAIARIGTARWRTGENPLLFTSDGRLAIVDATKPGLIDAKTGKLLRQFDVESYRSFLMPDDKTVVVTGGPKTGLRFLDIDSGKVLKQFPIEGYQCSWSRDGKRMASLRFDEKNRRSITVWDLDTAKAIQTWDKPFGDMLLAPDGKLLALRDNDHIELLDCIDGKQIRRWQSAPANHGRTSNARIMHFSPDGQILASAENDKRVTLWNPNTGKTIGAPLVTAHDGPVTLAFSRDGRYLAAGGSRGVLYIWDVAASKLVRTLENAGEGLPIYVVDFTPDSKTLISQAHLFPSARLWDVSSGKELSPTEANATRVDAVTFSPDGKTLVTIGPGDLPSLWDPRTGKLMRRFNGHRYLGLNHGGAIAFTPDGKGLGMNFYHYLSLWNVADGKTIFQSKGNGPHDLAPGEDRILCANCAFDERTMLAITSGGAKRTQFGVRGAPDTKIPWTVIGKWDAGTNMVKPLFRVEAENLRRLDLAPDRNLVVGVGDVPDAKQDRYLFAWDSKRGVELFRIPLTQADAHEGVTFSADSRAIFFSSDQLTPNERLHRFTVVEVASGKKRLVVEQKHDGPASSRGAVANDRLAAIANKDQLALIDPAANKVLRRWKTGAAIGCLAFSRDAKLLVTGCEDTTALVWDVAKLAAAIGNSGPIDLDEAWGKLKNDDAEAAYRAVLQMSAAPDAVGFLGKKLQPIAIVPEEQIRRLGNQLNSKVFLEREQASKELAHLGDAAEAELQNIVKNPASLETKRRAEDLLQQLRDKRSKGPFILSSEALREERAVETLERIGTPEAARLLARLASGSPFANLTRQARAAHSRLTASGKE